VSATNGHDGSMVMDAVLAQAIWNTLSPFLQVALGAVVAGMVQARYARKAGH
jgi:hypothetical protein